ncbi:MAG: potassium-transporting ATPase subunit C [Caldilineaceae bacterium]
MTLQRSRPFISTLLLIMGISMWLPGASTTLVAQSSAHSGSEPVVQTTHLWSAAASPPTEGAVAAPSSRYFGAGPTSMSQPALPIRLVPSAVMVHSYAAGAALYRAANQIDAARPVPANRIRTAHSKAAQQVHPRVAVQQAPAIAAARGLTLESVHQLIAWATDYPLFGLIGEPTVNLRLLNLALDDLDAR